MSTLMDKLLAITIANTVKGRTGNGKMTYLDRFVNCLLEDGQPTAPKSRTELIATMSYEIAVETREAEMLQNPELKPFDLDSPEDLIIFAEINQKVKNQVAAAVCDAKNPTSLSYNAQYKDVWQVVKNGNKVSLAPIEQDLNQDATPKRKGKKQEEIQDEVTAAE